MQFLAVFAAILATAVVGAPIDGSSLVARQSAGSTSTSTSNCTGLLCGLGTSGAAAAEDGNSTSSTSTTSCQFLEGCTGSSGAAGPSGSSSSSSSSGGLLGFLIPDETQPASGTA